MNSKGATDFTIAELKKVLREKGLATSGVKTELISRLNEADPTGAWMQVHTGRQDESEGGEVSAADRHTADVTRAQREASAEDRNATSVAHMQREVGASLCSAADVMYMQREMELFRREKELAQREPQLARQQIELLKGTQNLNISTSGTGIVHRTAPTQQEAIPVNISAVADLLSYFDGNGSTFETWRRQVETLITVYRLSDDMTKILIGSRLRGKAHEWFHSRSEYLAMSVVDLLNSLKDMFQRSESTLTARRRFEARVWRREESFTEYMHEKIILGNLVPISDAEIVEYVIEGIPDAGLRDLARVQKIRTKTDLLESFQGISLRGRSSPAIAPSAPSRSKDSRMRSSDAERTRNLPKSEARCFNCGNWDHYSAKCPDKGKGPKCFVCREFGHRAADCKKRGHDNHVNECTARTTRDNKVYKSVMIRDKHIVALLDTGSDLHLMRAEQYIKLGSPPLDGPEIMCKGLGSGNIHTLGSFCTGVRIDNNDFQLSIHVVSDAYLGYGLLLGSGLLKDANIYLDGTDVKISRHVDKTVVSCAVPEIYCINVFDEVESSEGRNICRVDLQHVENEKVKRELENLVKDYEPKGVKKTNIKMQLVLKDDIPVYQPPRRLAPAQREQVNIQIEKWLREGIIRESISEYASPVVLVKKKDGTLRLCVDFRQLNRKICKMRYPLPLIEDQLDRLQGAKLFSVLDLKDGFFHVPMHEESRKYTGFVVPDGHYEFLKVPFGLCNSPAAFQKFIMAIFRDLIRAGTVLIYLDDLIVPSYSEEDGMLKLREVLSIASDYGLNINWKKCRFLQHRIEYLGHIIEEGNVRPSERKTLAVVNFPSLRNARDVQSFLGLTGYFRKFIPQYSIVARPLSNLLKKDVKFEFSEEQKRAVQQLKSALTNEPVLKLYRVTAETELHTDASAHGLGAILLQRDDMDQRFHPVYYASWSTTEAESRYTSYELEVLAIVRAVNKFRVYLLGIPFRIVTDCCAFTQTLKKRDLCVRVARWALLLEEFDYCIEHRPGKGMAHVDALSRNPATICMYVRECEASVVSRLRKAQAEDVNLREMIELVNRNDETVREYIVRDGILCKIVDDDTRIVVPRAMQGNIIRQAHENGHFSSDKTVALIKKDYWFKNLRAKTEDVVRNCVPCILAERKTGKQDGFLNSIDKGETPLEVYHIDHLGPLPSTHKNYKYIFAVVDAFAKFVWFYTTKTTSTGEVIAHLRKQAIVFGNPRRIVSDRGTAFTSTEFQDYCKSEGIEHCLITTGMPRANGQVERINRTVIPLLTKISAPKPEEWHKHVNIAQQYLNATHHRSLGATPFKILFGANMRLKNNLEIRDIISREWVDIFQENRDELRRHAKESILKIQRENRTNFNKKRKEARQYRVDDLVAVKRTQTGPGLKIAHKYLGPYRVTRVLRKDRYFVEKVGEHEGPRRTSTAAEFMKPWINDIDDVLTDCEDACDV